MGPGIAGVLGGGAVASVGPGGCFADEPLTAFPSGIRGVIAQNRMVDQARRLLGVSTLPEDQLISQALAEVFCDLATRRGR